MPGSIRQLTNCANESSKRPRIHVLGLRSIGPFAAHSLSEIPNPPSFGLLCYRPSLLDAFCKNGSQISLETREAQRVDCKGHDLEVFRDGQWYSGKESANNGSAETSTIENLIVAVKATQTAYSYTDVFQIQLEKLAVNAFCNPLCALNDAENGFLFTLPEMRRGILTEISNLVCALPELQHVSNLRERFAVDGL